VTRGHDEAGRSNGRRTAPLTEGQCEAIHAASLEILETVGVRLQEPKAVKLLSEAGTRVSNGDRVHVSAEQIEWALSQAPSTVTLYDRSGDPSLVLDGSRSYFGPGSDALHIVDHRTDERRPPLVSDVETAATSCQRLPNIDFVMSMFLPVDVEQSIADRYQMRAMLNHTTKPIVFVSYDLSGSVDAVSMAQEVAGGGAALSDHPFVACYINTATGLQHNKDAVAKLLFLAERGIPALYIPGSMSGVTGPITIAGSVAVINAGMLVGLVLSQLTRSGAPFVMKGWGGGGLDMRTMVFGYGDPDSRRLASHMAGFYGLPCFGLAGASDSKVVDEQAAAEAALTIMADAASGADLIHDLGYLESGLSASLAQLAICDEIVAWTRRYLDSVEISPDTLAVDVVREVGVAGQFLATKHTTSHYRHMWSPRLFERDNYERWLAHDGRRLGERASALVEDLLTTAPDVSLPTSVDEVLASVVAEAEARIRR
jgi:trimethylamine--corrinoid protein Co-methyltransferase